MKNNTSYEVQVKPDHYFNRNYDTKERFVNYWHQIDEVLKLKPKNILEIGIGNGFVSNYLKKRQLDASTLDVDRRLKPTKTGSVLDIPYEDKSFDVVACFEVLEHLPWSNFEIALKELARVSKKNVILSLPHGSISFFEAVLRPPLITIANKRFLRFLIRLPYFNKDIAFNGEHYWEMGYKSYPVKKIKKSISKYFFIEDEYSPILDPYHHFFILKKKYID